WNSRPSNELVPRRGKGNALFESANDVQPIVDPHEAAEAAGLRYVSDSRPGIRRRNSRKVFTYTRADGSRLTEAEVLRRIKSLAVPPGPTCGSARRRTATSRPLAGTPGDVSNTVIIRASVRCAKAPSFSRLTPRTNCATTSRA